METALATVNTINLSKDEKEVVAKNARKEAMAEASAASARLLPQLTELFRHDKLRHESHAAFNEIIKDDKFRADLQTMRDYFAHKPTHEKLDGKYKRGEDWSQDKFGITYDYACRFIPKTATEPRDLIKPKAERKPTEPKPTSNRSTTVSPTETPITALTVSDAANATYVTIEEDVRHTMNYVRSVVKTYTDADRVDFYKRLVEDCETEAAFITAEATVAVEEAVKA